MNVKKLSLWLVGIMVVCFVIGGVIASVTYSVTPSEQYKIDEAQSFPMGGIELIDIDETAINIEISTHEQNTIDLHLTGTMFGDEAYKPKLQARDHYGILEVGLQQPEQQFHLFKFWGLHDYTLEIIVPKDYEAGLNIELSSGNLHLSDIELLQLNAIASSGNIHLEDVQARKIDTKISSGNIELKNVDALHLKATTSSGNIVGTQVSASEVEAQGSSGNIVLAFDTLTGSLEAKTSSGNVIIDLPDSRTYLYNLDVTSGNIRNELENRDVLETGGDLASAIRIDASATSGNVIVR